MHVAWRPASVRSPARGARVRAVAGIVALVTTMLVLHGIDHPAVTPPASTDGVAWSTWATTAGPVGLVMAAVRVAALVLSWYLLVATTLAVLAHLTRSRQVGAVTAAVTTPRARDLVLAVLGTGLMSTAPLDVAVTTPVVGGSHADPSGAPAALDLDHPPRQTTGADPARSDRATHALATAVHPTVSRGPRNGRVGDNAPTTRLRRLPADHVDAGDVRMVRLDPTPDATDRGDGPRMRRLDPDDGDEVPATRDAVDQRWFTVAPGDHFWRIAEEQVTAHRGPDAALDLVRRYWRRLVDGNRDLLVDPANPDLLFPGQVLRLPPVDERAAT